MKTCSKCGTQKTEDEYYKSAQGRREAACKNCRQLRAYDLRRQKRIAQGLNVRISTLESRRLRSQGERYCPKCRQVKPLTDFSTTKVRLGVASHCRLCSNVMTKTAPSYQPETRRERYQVDKDRRRDVRLQKKFGIAHIEYEVMLRAQGGLCAICKNKQKGKRLAVDHNHRTGAVRALLCNNCNAALGFIKDCPKIALSLAEYLMVHDNFLSTY